MHESACFLLANLATMQEVMIQHTGSPEIHVSRRYYASPFFFEFPLFLKADGVWVCHRKLAARVLSSAHRQFLFLLAETTIFPSPYFSRLTIRSVMLIYRISG